MKKSPAAVMAKIAALHAFFAQVLQRKDRYGAAEEWIHADLVDNHIVLALKAIDDARVAIPDFFEEIPDITLETGNGAYSDSFRRRDIQQLYGMLAYMLQVRAESGDTSPGATSRSAPGQAGPIIFLTHGRSPQWYKVRDFLEREEKLTVVELEQRPNLGRSVLQKLMDESKDARAAVIVMTGDDDGHEQPRARQNVMHEVGFFQGKLGPDKVCILYEEGTEIPSNIHGLVYIPFPPGYIDATFQKLRKELAAMAGIH